MPTQFIKKPIEEDQCIGDSLETLNYNFSALDVAVQNSTQATSTTILALSALALGSTGFRNKLINAQGLINQRGYVSGTNLTTSSRYTLDRWEIVTLGQELLFAIDNVNTNAVRFTAPIGGIQQVIEGVNIEGGTYVLYWAGDATARVNNVVRAKGETFNLAGRDNCTVRFSDGNFRSPQLEKATVPHAFEYRPFGTELALCQRYFCKTYDLTTTPGTADADGAIWAHSNEPTSPTIHNIGWSFPVSMRVKPACRAYSPVTGAVNRVYISTAPKVDITVDSIERSTNRISYVNLANNLTPTQSRQFTVHYTADAEI